MAYPNSTLQVRQYPAAIPSLNRGKNRRKYTVFGLKMHIFINLSFFREKIFLKTHNISDDMPIFATSVAYLIALNEHDVL